MPAIAINSPHAVPETGAVTISESQQQRSARFERDVLPMRDILLRRARRLNVSQADADDLLQETLLAAYRGFHTFAPGTSLQAWLFRIMRNTWITIYRSRQCRPEEVFIDAVRDSELAASTARTSKRVRSAEDEVMDVLPSSRLREAFEALPESQRIVAYYAHVQGLTYAEIAAVLDVPLGTVMSRVHRGRKRLRMALSDHAPTTRCRGDLSARPA